MVQNVHFLGLSTLLETGDPSPRGKNKNKYVNKQTNINKKQNKKQTKNKIQKPKKQNKTLNKSNSNKQDPGQVYSDKFVQLNYPFHILNLIPSCNIYIDHFKIFKEM